MQAAITGTLGKVLSRLGTRPRRAMELVDFRGRYAHTTPHSDMTSN
jgi:hypothetical protein